MASQESALFVLKSGEGRTAARSVFVLFLGMAAGGRQVAECSLFRWQRRSWGAGTGGFINHLTVTCAPLHSTERTKKEKFLPRNKNSPSEDACSGSLPETAERVGTKRTGGAASD